MNIQNLPEEPVLPQPRSLEELELLKDYSHYIMHHVNKLRLHPDHKDDLKEVLLQAMVQITLNLQEREIPSKTNGFLSRLLYKTAR